MSGNVQRARRGANSEIGVIGNRHMVLAAALSCKPHVVLVFRDERAKQDRRLPVHHRQCGLRGRSTTM